MSCCSQKKAQKSEVPAKSQASNSCCGGNNVTDAQRASVRREDGGISFCECSAVSVCACSAEECQCANCADHKL